MVRVCIVCCAMKAGVSGFVGWAVATGSYLAMCPVMSLRHAAVGLLIAGFMLEAAIAGGRYAPEPLNFVTDLIASAASGAT